MSKPSSPDSYKVCLTCKSGCERGSRECALGPGQCGLARRTQQVTAWAPSAVCSGHTDTCYKDSITLISTQGDWA